MLKFILNKIAGTQNERELKLLAPIIEEINKFEPKISVLSDEGLKAKTSEFRERIQKASGSYLIELADLESQLKEASAEQREKIKAQIKAIRNEIYAQVLPEAFAVVREAGRRFVNMRHFDAQLIGGLVLHEGKIAEMATGEGKTLVATLAAYLNALSGRGVHIVTVNDYLAKRDSEWMGPIYHGLGLSVGVIQHDLSPADRQVAYACDIVYGTNNEFGFDYLRDNMVISKEEMAQRPHHYAIIDEVDSILVDEARTPLIISGPAEESTEKYYIVDRIVPKLKGRLILEKDEIDAKYKGIDLSKGFDYIVDEKAHTAHLTDEGETKAAELLHIDNMHDIENMDWRHHIIQALRAHNLFRLDRDYVVKDGQVIIVDEFTGRLMPGRRWSDGLHQAVEAKEGLKIERENQTLATITLQNYFKIYEKCAGMTGTAFTEAAEFKEIYGLDVVIIPTNKPLIRTNFADSVFKTQKEKFNAVADEIAKWNELGRPLLVGTISIEKSEMLSDILKRRGVQHNVLNAKYHEMEAQIVAQAGRFKSVTIATNMAGRGTDILLGGNPEFIVKNLLKAKGIKPEDENYQEEFKNLYEKYKKEWSEEHKKVVGLGGLHVIGTERHEARRIDNQLRGRAGRQGDPGSSRFYVSFEDDLMRLFGQDRIIGLMDKLGWQEGLAIEHPWVSKSIETAQKRVENHNFEIRKQLLEYDNVMNKQRELIYSQRKAVLEGQDIKQVILDMISDSVDEAVNLYLPKEIQHWDLRGLENWAKLKFALDLSLESHSGSAEDLKEFLLAQITSAYNKKQDAISEEHMRLLERMVMLQVVDVKWKDHLYAMDNLREGITLRAYGQRDPLVEYQHEGFDMFSEMINNIKSETVEFIFRAQAIQEERQRPKSVFKQVPQEFIHEEAETFDRTKISQIKAAEFSPEEPPPKPQPVKTGPKVGRNDPCPCGSGKKYKKCCGK